MVTFEFRVPLKAIIIGGVVVRKGSCVGKYVLSAFFGKVTLCGETIEEVLDIAGENNLKNCEIIRLDDEKKCKKYFLCHVGIDATELNYSLKN